jgi:general nucleoside transport system permease protein
MLHLLASSTIWYQTLQAATSLLLVTLGLYLPYRAGVLNLGGEGIMLAACFGAVLAEDKTGGGALAGTLAGAVSGILIAALFALLTVGLGANGLVVGLALNFATAGGTAVATTALYGISGAISTPNLRTLPTWHLPGFGRLPWIAQVVSGQTPLTYLSWAAAAAVAWYLHHTRAGLTIRAAGTRPDVVAGAGRSVTRVQWLCLTAGGALIGLGAAQLALSSVAQFSYNMTAGRGFVALALTLIAGTRSLLLVPLAIAFALFDIYGVNLQSAGLPAELSSVVPYAAVVVLLVLTRLLRRPGRGPGEPHPRASIAIAGAGQVTGDSLEEAGRP